MYSKLLVPIDGSHLSEAILPHARSVSKTLNLPVELLRVTGLRSKSTFRYPRFRRCDSSVEAEITKRHMDYLESVASSFPEASTITCSVEVGHAAEVIVAKAAAHSGTLIAMSTRGRSGFQRWVLGSVADRVLHESKNPLLLVKATPQSKTAGMARVESVLVPLDGSLLAELALPHVAALANEFKLGVVLLSVYSSAPMDYVAAAYMPAPQRAAVSTKQGAKFYLEGKARELRDAGVDKVSWLLLEGDAPREITKISRQMPDNLVIMCSHGRSGTTRWVLGSVTDRIIRHGGDPVLVVRAQANQEFSHAGVCAVKIDRPGINPNTSSDHSAPTH